MIESAQRFSLWRQQMMATGSRSADFHYSAASRRNAAFRPLVKNSADAFWAGGNCILGKLTHPARQIALRFGERAVSAGRYNHAAPSHPAHPLMRSSDHRNPGGIAYREADASRSPKRIAIWRAARCQPAGTSSHERMWTALATCRKQQRSFFESLKSSIEAKLRKQPTPSLLNG